MNQSFENSSETTIKNMDNVDCGPSKTHPSAPVKEKVKIDNDLYYDMSGEKKLIIFNHYKFEDNKCYKTPSLRPGTNADKKELKKTFKNLGFTVTEADDFKHCEIIQLLKEVAKSDHTRTSCIAVAILTHGTHGGILFAKDTFYPLSEVTDIFLNETSLSGKPKLFFIQACRGNQSDDVTVANVPDPDMPLLDQEDNDRSENIEAEVLTVPTRHDTIVLYACREGFKSYRNKKRGSRMIQSLCRQIQKRHVDDDIQDIIIRVIKEVVEQKSLKRQHPEAEFACTKKLTFAYQLV